MLEFQCQTYGMYHVRDITRDDRFRAMGLVRAEYMLPSRVNRRVIDAFFVCSTSHQFMAMETLNTMLESNISLNKWCAFSFKERGPEPRIIMTVNGIPQAPSNGYA